MTESIPDLGENYIVYIALFNRFDRFDRLSLCERIRRFYRLLVRCMAVGLQYIEIIIVFSGRAGKGRERRGDG
jgi:hypothetical protein